MELVRTIAQLRDAVGGWRARGERVALVPTMGALHEGHLALVDAARGRTARVVASVFVNPLQFGPTEDLARYPRNLERDRALLEERGVDLLYAPSVEEMYPDSVQVTVEPGVLATYWDGAARPAHFAGVLTVVAKLFNQVGPDVAVFGQKDFQQVTVIGRMIRDLNWPIELIVAPTVREADGLALSSRNVYLTPADRIEARRLSAALREMQRAWEAGESDPGRLEVLGRGVLEAGQGIVVDYVAVVDPATLQQPKRADQASVVLIAARVGTTRLIDNAALGRPLDRL